MSGTSDEREVHDRAFAYLRGRLDQLSEAPSASGAERMAAALCVHYIDQGRGQDARRLIHSFVVRHSSSRA